MSTDTPTNSATDSANGGGGANPAAAGKAIKGLVSEWQEWQQKTQGMHRAAADKAWTAKELAGINPKDIGVMFGPVLTEEQFRALGKTDKHVIRSVRK